MRYYPNIAIVAMCEHGKTFMFTLYFVSMVHYVTTTGSYTCMNTSRPSVRVWSVHTVYSGSNSHHSITLHTLCPPSTLLPSTNFHHSPIYTRAHQTAHTLLTNRRTIYLKLLGYGSFYAFAFTLPMLLHYINKLNQYWSSYVAPFMQLHSRYQCVTHTVTHAFIFSSV